MDEFILKLQALFKGDITKDDETLEKYSHDASLFEVRPKVVVYPKDTEDIKALVRLVTEHKKINPTLAITPRAAGTDMTGGSIGNSIILDVTRYMNAIKEVKDDYAVVLPGCYYRDFDKETKKINRFMPAFTASREINAVGGMVGNNSGGEKAIKYGKTERYILSLKVVLSDANEYVIKSLTKEELEKKIADTQHIFESELYKKIYALINENYEKIIGAKPDVSKNSAGYYLWNVYDKTTGKFDLCQLIVGSQGTLGIVTEITFKLVPLEPYSNVLAVFLPSLDHVSLLVKEIIPFKPDSLETYDDKSMILAVRFFFDFFKQMGFWGALKLGYQFIPETWMMATGGVPKLILMIEFTGQTEEQVKKKLQEVYDHIKHFGLKMHIAKSSTEADKYWRIRHESFNLLRKHTKGMRTAPFIDDVIVKPEFLPEFLPKVKALLDEYKLDYTIQGHLGNGNFHLIPLMDLNSPFSAEVILELSKKMYTLVHEYHGSITAEHNDGIIRTPYLAQQYGDEIVKLFQDTKNIFDPLNIFNPGKKVGGTFDDIRKAIRKEN
jgi:FAD/FMN-containing dehydrogenase